MFLDRREVAFPRNVGQIAWTHGSVATRFQGCVLETGTEISQIFMALHHSSIVAYFAANIHTCTDGAGTKPRRAGVAPKVDRPVILGFVANAL